MSLAEHDAHHIDNTRMPFSELSVPTGRAVNSSRTTQGHRTGGGLSPSARGRGVTCKLRSPRLSGLHVAGASSKSGGGATRKLAARACRATLAVIASCTKKGYLTVERPLSFGARTLCDMPAAASQNQLAFAWHTRARFCARYLSGGGVARELVPRARPAEMVRIALRTR